VQVGLRLLGQDERGDRVLAEVEGGPHVAQGWIVLPNVGSGVRPSIGRGIEPLALQEVVLDELHVCVEGQRLVVDQACPGIGADHQRGTRNP